MAEKDGVKTMLKALAHSVAHFLLLTFGVAAVDAAKEFTDHLLDHVKERVQALDNNAQTIVVSAIPNAANAYTEGEGRHASDDTPHGAPLQLHRSEAVAGVGESVPQADGADKALAESDAVA